MALPSSKTSQELAAMKHGALVRYFLSHARFMPDAPPRHRYAIQLGSRSISDSDTQLLRDRFIAAVRKIGAKKK